jgi:hypothetical protein
MTQVPNEGEHLTGANGVVLGERTMGTDAQVRYLMGNADGTGWMDKGMTNLDSLIDVDPQTATEIEALLLPSDANGEIYVPKNLIEMRDWFNSVSFSGESPVHELAAAALAEIKEGVARAINYCTTYAGTLEQELRQGQSGGIGIKSLSASMKYYFEQINAPLPDDRAGANAGAELSKALAPLLEKIGVQAGPLPAGEDAVAHTIELEATKARLEAAEATIKQQEEAIESLTAPEVKNDTE